MIRRCLFENPSWYTPYTPYQAEIAQGRLESLLNFQTMVTDLTGMEVANASLLDEGTAAGEAMTLLHRVQAKKLGDDGGVFLVSDRCFPQTIEVLRSRAEPLGIELRVGPTRRDDVRRAGVRRAAAVSRRSGPARRSAPVHRAAHAAGVLVAVATDLLALALLTPPGEMGADVVVRQLAAVRRAARVRRTARGVLRHAKNEFVRHMPGRIIGVSVDAQGKPAYRMALQTREQHIRREKATSNICTAQALLANMAAMYAVYHGPRGSAAIADARARPDARRSTSRCATLGFRQQNDAFFDTLRVIGHRRRRWPTCAPQAVDGGLELPLRRTTAQSASALDETATVEDVRRLSRVFAGAAGKTAPERSTPLIDRRAAMCIPAPLRRTSAFLTHPVFNAHHSETEMMRYIKSLERKDIGLDTSMIPLGSCTMKLNAASEMYPVSWEEFSRMHPFAPADQTDGYAADLPRARGGAVRDHRLRGRVAAAELRRAGRIRRPAGHSRVSPARAATAHATSC